MLSLIALSTAVVEASQAFIGMIYHLAFIGIDAAGGRGGGNNNNTGANAGGAAGWEGDGSDVQPDNIANKVRDFVGPLLLLGISVFAVKFLAQRRMTQFFQFAGLAVLIAVLFWGSGLVESFGKTVASWF